MVPGDKSKTDSLSATYANTWLIRFLDRASAEFAGQRLMRVCHKNAGGLFSAQNHGVIPKSLWLFKTTVVFEKNPSPAKSAIWRSHFFSTFKVRL